ncbi:hypothetical protein BJX76DRAFT_337065, partial [Aspergillus varians]
RPGASQTVTHKTGISIAALDISPQRTHAVIGGKEILKTIRVLPDHSSEEFNLRNAIIGYSSTHHAGGGLSARHKDQLTVKDVKWSHGPFDQIIATAVANGRIVVYDLHRTGLEYCRFQGHSRQVHRLAFNPHHPAWLLSGSQDAHIRMWDLRAVPTDRGVSVCGSRDNYNGNSDSIRDIRWSPADGVLFAAATDSGAIQLWDIRKSSSPVMRITAHDRPCYSVDWHPDGRHIVSGGTDRQVKVWDFSINAERRQKPSFQFRTPQAVLNVRWRPPSWSGEIDGSGDWQSSQVVTSYDKEDPRVHLWDFRRPHIPFREFDRYDSTATDLLWHSKDLLWTVGDGGVFTQTDIRYAPQVVNQRPTCSVAWSPSGEVIAFSQKRPRRSILGLSTNEFIGHPGEEDNSGETLSQSPGEEAVVDEPLFAAIRPRHSKSSSIHTSKSLGSTPPAATDLDTSPTPCQMGMVVNVPGATMDRETFQYLARQYSPLLQGKLNSLNYNARCAEDISLDKLAQTWRVAREREQQASEKNPRNIKKKSSFDDPVVEKKMKTRFFKGVIESEAPKHTLSDIESASSMTTPLAQPLPDSPPGSYGNPNSQFRSLNDAGDIQPLPPSVLSSNQGTMASNDWSSMSDIGSRPILQLQHRESNDSENVRMPSDSPPFGRRDSIPIEVEEEQRSAPLAIAGRADWHNRSRPRLTKQTSEVDEFDQKLEDKRAAIRDYKLFPKKPLSLESHAGSAKPGFYRHESTESFPMFSASTTSSHPSKLYDAHEVVENGDNVASRSDILLRPRGDSILTTNSISEEDFEIEASFGDSPTGHNHFHLDRPSTPPPLLKESTPLKSPPAVGDASTHSISDFPNGLPHISIPILSGQRNDNPWSAEVLEHKLHILIEDCENVLPGEESEAIFKAYNESLLRQSMYIEAAELRLLCVPSYPAVYEYAQGDTYMNNDNTRCHRCSTPQEPCTICMSLNPPPEWVTEENSDVTSHLLSSSHSSPRAEPIPPSELRRIDGTASEMYQRARPKGTTLWSCTWLKDIDISEGPRRESNRKILLDESKKRDSASRKAGVGFSKAVEKVRGMLGGVGGGASAGSASTTTTMTTSVAPSATSSNLIEQERPLRTSSTRTSFG